MQNPAILVNQTHNENQSTHPSLEIENEHSYTENQTTHSSLEIDNEHSYEHWTEWDFITFHKGIHHSVKNALTDFQQKNILEWNVTNQNGVFGCLVNGIGNVFIIIRA